MGTLKTVLIVIEAICSIALIVVVLLQSGKEAGLSSALTGASETYLSKNKQGNLDFRGLLLWLPQTAAAPSGDAFLIKIKILIRK